MKKNLLVTMTLFTALSNMAFLGHSTATAATTKTTTKTTTKATTVSKTTKKATTATKTSTTKNKKYKDGVYTGSAVGFRGHGYNGVTKVSVTVKKDKITSVKVVSIGDTPRFYETPVEEIPQEILKAQSTNVDVVSGATFSSKGIINAVSAALKKAKL